MNINKRKMTGQKIKELRLQKGMTQEELAAKTDLSVRTIQRIEKGEVDPRTFTLHAIADALDVDFELINELDSEADEIKQDHLKWLAFLHLSGLFCMLFPPLLIWIFKKQEIPEMEMHGKMVINFQLSMWLYLFSASLLLIILVGLPILVFLGVFSTIIIIINTAKVMGGKDCRYPLSLKILK